MNNFVIDCLLEDDNLAVKYWTLTEIFEMRKESANAEATHKALLSSGLLKSVVAFDVGDVLLSLKSNQSN